MSLGTRVRRGLEHACQFGAVALFYASMRVSPHDHGLFEDVARTFVNPASDPPTPDEFMDDLDAEIADTLDEMGDGFDEVIDDAFDEAIDDFDGLPHQDEAAGSGPAFGVDPFDGGPFMDDGAVEPDAPDAIFVGQLQVFSGDRSGTATVFDGDDHVGDLTEADLREVFADG